MSEYDNSAILFPNFAKKQVSHPDYRGTATVAGVEYDLSAWKKRGKRGEFFSIKFTRQGKGKPQPENPNEPAVFKDANVSGGEVVFGPAGKVESGQIF